ncbi:hypothetical protein H5410_026905 [Solanum commersonii]|uniref:Uncharacterized protein n=1 Tax=Solanum commersonii TaxID=4109 RepID=A0A9J5YZU2_SOLCO|nr:hypothetical protein H5410_026905 [Solanum commersonii]
MTIIKKKSTIKNSRKEEYDIPQLLDLLNKWTIPKISPRIIYHMGTFAKLGLKQVGKITEETITIDSDNQTFRLLSDNNLAPYRDIYRFMHIDLISLQDENSLSSLILNVKLHDYDYMPDTEVVCICYRIYYKLLHTLNPMCKVIDFKNENILIETNFDKSKVVTRRPIKWEEIDFPQEWVIENATQPRNNINTDVSEIEQLNDESVKIRFAESANMLIDNKRDFMLSNGEIIKFVFPPLQSGQINKNDKIVNFNAFSKLFETNTALVTTQHVNVMIKQNNYANIYMSILGEHIISLHDKVDKIISLLPTKVKGKEKIAHSSLQPPPEIEDFKIKEYSDLEKFLEKRLTRGGV